MTPLIDIQNLSAGYGSHRVLHDVNLTIRQGDFLGLIGPNGGGKTTLLKCILGLLQPQEGKVVYHPSTLRLGYMPQYNHIDRKFPITVIDTILSGLIAERRHHTHWSADERDRAQQALRQMGLEGMEQRPIGALSGGELQRVLLGRAVVSNPEVLVRAAPGPYIDKRTESRLYQQLDDLNRNSAINLVSHDIESLLSHARTIALVDRELTYYPSSEAFKEKYTERR